MKNVHLYMVYSRDTELVGVSEGYGDRHVVKVSKTGACRDETIKASRLPEYLAALSRKGYVLRSQHHFFNEEAATFVLQHPDFPIRPGANYVLFIQPSSVETGIAVVDALVAKCNALKADPQVRTWIGQKLMSSDFLVADVSSPLWALLLAEAAHVSNWAISPARDHMPEASPSSAPAEWQEWLKNFFDITSISRAQRALGWTLSELLSMNESAIPPAEMLIVDFI
ncbi:hypothetical protein LJR189_004694 [Acidovorax delafieldii]|jgi:hypothetical protein|uniref:hypothetical protein n=1 Tax=Acidovorax delafieldii TaxID=47920 RepID=UPI003ED11A0F